MAEIFNVRPRDYAEIIPLSQKDWNKLYKFIKYNYSEASAIHFKRLTNSNNESLKNLNLTIEYVKKTERTGTEFASCIGRIPGYDAFRIFVQLRFIKVIGRKSNHRLTNIFNSFWKPKESKV